MANATEINPILSKAQLSAINSARSGVDRALTQCDLAESCGVDCESRRQELDAIREELDMFKRTYFPSAK